MQNKKVIFSIVTLLLMCGLANSQNRTFSPYSRYGIGDLQGAMTGRSQAMGGTGVAQRSRYSLNDINPAGLTAMDSLSFIFEGGVGYFQQKLSANSGSATFGNGNFDLFSFGFPLNRWAFTSIGLKPYSSVGYNIASTQGTSSGTYKGEGSITKGFIAFGFKPYKNFSFGVNVGYLFGIQKHFFYQEFSDVTYGARFGTLNEISVNDLTLDFGAQYTMNINDRKRWIFGATFTPQSNMSGDLTFLRESGTTINPSSGIYYSGDTLSSNTTSLKSNNYKLPLQIGLGATYEIVDKLSASVDYTFSNWSNTPFGDKITVTKNSQQIALGAEFIPNDLKAESFFSRMRYRAGTYYKNDYLVVNGHQLVDYGITIGAGVPLRRSKNSVNIGLNWGQRGTTDFGLIRENYFKISINVVMQEVWFMKRKFE